MPMTIGGTTYSDDQIRQFIAEGGDPNAFLQEQGVTNQDLIHTLSTQARGIAGDATPTGDAALQNYFKSYQKYNPNGAYANNFAGWVNDLGAGTANAMRAGVYSGAVTAPKDFGPTGIYGPGTGHDFSYQENGLGARGMGEGWTPGAAGLNTGPQTSQPMSINSNGALTYTATGTSTAPKPGEAGWIQPPQGVSREPIGSSLVGSNGSQPSQQPPVYGGGPLTQVGNTGPNPYQHIYRPDQQGPWMNYHADGLPSSAPLTFHPLSAESRYANNGQASPQSRLTQPVPPPELQGALSSLQP